MANAGLLKLTMDYITLFPEKHDQSDWVNPCDSTMCFAGHAAMLTGATFKNKIYSETGEWMVDAVSGKHKRWDWDDESQNLVEIQTWARDQLGLTQREADYLFSDRRTVWQLKEAVQKFSNGYTVDYYGNFEKKGI